MRRSRWAPAASLRPVQPTGRLLAAGRDCDVYEHSPGLVLRRSRAGRSLEAEARVMSHARQLGYPVPAVAELADDDTIMVLERVEGESMVDAIRRRPWTVRAQGRLLADLHTRLHALPAPDWLPPAPCGAGDRLLHLDLHPLNVLLGPDGPMVIDWAGAARGDGGVDVALAWALMGGGTVPGGRVVAALLGLGRSLLVGSFLKACAAADLESARRLLADVVEWKVTDPHMSVAEQAAMRRVADRAGAGAGTGTGTGETP